MEKQAVNDMGERSDMLWMFLMTLEDNDYKLFSFKSLSVFQNVWCSEFQRLSKHFLFENPTPWEWHTLKMYEVKLRTQK